MDVSGWTNEQRMQLPDWCFPNQRIVDTYQYNNLPGVWNYKISTDVLPDPCCLWSVFIRTFPTTNGTGQLRIAMADMLPVNQAQFDACDEILPGYGLPNVGPNRIQLYAQVPVFNQMTIRRLLVTGGQRMVISLNCVAATMRAGCALTVSGLPTNVNSRWYRGL